MKWCYGYFILLICSLSTLSCNNSSKGRSEDVVISINSTGLKVNYDRSKAQHLRLKTFLENPFDLNSFKSKKQRLVTTSITPAKSYFNIPKHPDSIFYSYFFKSPDIDGSRNINSVVVFKYGINKHTYIDSTEFLIEMKVYSEDRDLIKANLVGLDKKEIKKKFGRKYERFSKGFYYVLDDKLLAFYEKESIIDAYYYVRLSNTNYSKKQLLKVLDTVK